MQINIDPVDLLQMNKPNKQDRAGGARAALLSECDVKMIRRR